ncbi:hypothetical protein D3C85_1519960 [compost metagenome]
MAWRISAPAPLDRINGTTPAMKAIEVIRIGRRRRRAASIAAWRIERPWCSSSWANSTIRIAFLQASPTSTTKLIWVNRLLSPPVSHTPVIADRMPMGTISNTASGRLRLSYCAASTKNTSSIASGRMMIRVLPAILSW